RLVAVAGGLFQGAQEQAGSDAVQATGERGRGRGVGRTQAGGRPGLLLAGPGQGGGGQGGPRQDRGQDPQGGGGIFLVKVLGDRLEQAIQQRPEFAFHDTSPWFCFPRLIRQRTRTRLFSTT